MEGLDIWRASRNSQTVVSCPAAEGRMPEADRHGAERDNKRRKKKPRSRKPWELGSEGEETSDGSSTEKVFFFHPVIFKFLLLLFLVARWQHFITMF